MTGAGAERKSLTGGKGGKKLAKKKSGEDASGTESATSATDASGVESEKKVGPDGEELG